MTEITIVNAGVKANKHDKTVFLKINDIMLSFDYKPADDMQLADQLMSSFLDIKYLIEHGRIKIS